MEIKKKKTKQEVTAEEYFPIDKERLGKTTEKKIKDQEETETIIKKSTNISPKEKIQKTTSTVEKSYNKPERKTLEIVEKFTTPKTTKKKTSKKKITKKKTVKKKSTVTKFSPQKINLKTNGYELVITEKPQAALKIANALGDAVNKNVSGVPYYEVSRGNQKIIVACAVGHLFTLKQSIPGSKVPTFEVDWTPNYLARKKDFTKKYYDLLSKLAKQAGSLTVATDFDVEGEVIGLNVVRFICGQKDAKRMKFSTLTKDELNNAYEKKLPNIVWGQAIAGETRHYLDWFYGINLSRALMNAIKSTGKFRIMSSGRVQGPALKMIVDKEKEIQKFEPVPYWQSFITIKEGRKKIELKHTKDIFDKKELKQFEKLTGEKAETKTTKTEQTLPPHPPFNLTTLQTEAYKFYGITPSNTLKAAQSLYLAGLISYPRTSSQKLPKEIGYKKILDTLAKKYKVTEFITKSKPIEGKKTDPAHPSIYPTGNSQILSGNEEKIYDLIVKRFLSLFCDNAIIDKKRINAIINNLNFSTNGSEIRKKAWMAIYPSKLKEIQLPDVDGEKEIIDSKIEEKETQPPKRFSQASIISELEKRNLGTKATRSSILETLYDRGYVKEKSIEATPMGISLINTLEKYSPIIVDEELTRNFEKEMDKIAKAKKDFEKMEEKIIEKSKETITKIAKDFEKHEKKIGEELLTANIKQREKEKEENKLILCPKCKKGHLAITYSPKNKKFFIACDAYPNCKTTYSLPPNGVIKKTGKLCEKCGFPLLMTLRQGKRPWIFCFNSECETNKERIEEYKKKLAEQNQEN